MILQCCNNDVDHDYENTSLLRINNLRNVATTIIPAPISDQMKQMYCLTETHFIVILRQCLSD